jgi:hypothetical protein
LKLGGKLIKNTRVIMDVMVEREDESKPFRDILEECFLEICKSLDIPVPLWLKKNTTEFAAYKRTFFNSEHFVEKINFDRFEIRMDKV